MLSCLFASINILFLYSDQNNCKDWNQQRKSGPTQLNHHNYAYGPPLLNELCWGKDNFVLYPFNKEKNYVCKNMEGRYI
jgi:hypothetical protein